MRCYCGDPDVEMQGQTCDKAEVKTSSEKKEKKTRTDQVQESIRTILQLKNLLLVLCVISVAVDPLFFYLPVINEERKCVVLDRRLYIITTCLRTVLDFISLVNIIWKCFHLSNYIDKKAPLPQEQNGGLPSKDARSNAKRRYLLSLAIEVLAILPFPQVLIRIIFSKMKGSQSLNERKVLTAVILFQYLPRALRIYPSWKNVFIHVNPSNNLPKRVIVVKATFNLLLYIIASHVLGGVWYFLSVERETACWHYACKNHIECDRRSSFDCNHDFGNYTFLNDSCPTDTPNTTVFDFGIFQGALQSGTVASMDFPRKTLYCFWWGLRNLSSFGSNLQTSTYFWENCFSVLTSILGLLLFIYFIGHLQMYMQWGASIELEKAMIRKLEQWDEAKKFGEKEKRRKYGMKIKKQKIHGWIDRNPRLKEIETLIMDGVDRTFEQNKDIDAENPLPHFPKFTRTKILQHLCLPLLQKVPMLQDKLEPSVRMICMNLKPLYFNEHTYIFREGEPIDMILLITQGIVLKFPITSKSSGETPTVEYIEEGHFYGIELLQWATDHGSSSPPSLSNLPISTKALKTRTKVEAFGLMAKDVKALLSINSNIEEESALTMQSAWRHHFKRKEKKHEDKSLCQEYCFNCLRFRRSSS